MFYVRCYFELAVKAFDESFYLLLFPQETPYYTNAVYHSCKLVSLM